MLQYFSSLVVLRKETRLLSNMASITVPIPGHRLESVRWITRIPPETAADLLEGLEVIWTASYPDTVQIQNEHHDTLLRLREEHEKAIQETRAERERSEARLTAERECYRHQLETFLREEIRRQMELGPDETDPSLEEELTEIISQHYTARGRLPRNVGDILPRLSQERQTELLANASIYDSVVNRIKGDHYRNKKPRTVEP